MLFCAAKKCLVKNLITLKSEIFFRKSASRRRYVCQHKCHISNFEEDTEFARNVSQVIRGHNTTHCDSMTHCAMSYRMPLTAAHSQEIWAQAVRLREHNRTDSKTDGSSLHDECKRPATMPINSSTYHAHVISRITAWNMLGNISLKWFVSWNVFVAAYTGTKSAGDRHKKLLGQQWRFHL